MGKKQQERRKRDFEIEVPDGSGCTEIWERMNELRNTDTDEESDEDL